MPAEAATGPVVRELLETGSHMLRVAAHPHARRTAMQVLGAVLGRDPGRLVLEGNQAVQGGVRIAYLARIKRLAEGEPVAYVLGTAGFRTLELEVDRRVLIPRPETEGLVQLVLDWAGQRPRGGGVVADIGTGSGCIALALASEGRFQRIVASDVSSHALAVARRNLERVRPPVPVELRVGDLLEPVAGERLDGIVSNPPYVSEAEWGKLDAGVRLHEPKEALVSVGGMQHIERLLIGAGGLLRPGGLLVVEIDDRRSRGTLELARRSGWPRAEVRRDLFGRNRFILMTKGES